LALTLAVMRPLYLRHEFLLTSTTVGHIEFVIKML